LNPRLAKRNLAHQLHFCDDAYVAGGAHDDDDHGDVDDENDDAHGDGGDHDDVSDEHDGVRGDGDARGDEVVQLVLFVIH